MYSIRSFLVSGCTVYGIAGALMGAVSGLTIGMTIALPSLLGSLVEPWIAVIAIIIIPIAVGISALFGGVVGAIYGGLRASLIGNALTEGRGWLVALLAIVLAIFFVDIASGLALFLIWSAFRFIPLNDFSELGFFRVMWRYIFIYVLIFLVIGLIGGSGLGGLLGYLANESNDYSAINNAVWQLSQFVNSFYLEVGAVTSDGLFSAGLSGVVLEETSELDIQSSINLANAQGTIFSYVGEITSNVNDFLGSVQGNVAVEQAGGLPQQFALVEGVAADFFSNSQLGSGAVSSAVSGGILGATLAVVYGVVFSIILAILDFLVVKNVTNKNLPFAADGLDLVGGNTEYMDSADPVADLDPPASSSKGKKK